MARRMKPDRGATASASPADHPSSAAAAGLRYVTDGSPGFCRRRSGRGFVYLDRRGERVRSPTELTRIRGLAIPPAWSDVWISADPAGHLQAVGRDARGRKQYRYHPKWRSVRDRTKYDRIRAFARALPRIRRAVRRDLALPRLPRAKVLAAVVRLLESTQIRVGNPEYLRQNNSRGLTTLDNRHVAVSGSRLRFRFRGKSGRIREVETSDARLARIVRRCQEIPGQELFQYLDEEGTPRNVTSGDVNQYLREISGEEFTAKDFRTWAGTALANASLKRLGAARSKAQAKRNVVRVIAAVAERLGNTPAICRKSYIHPRVIDSYLEKSMLAHGGPSPTARTSAAERRRFLALSRRLASALKTDEAALAPLSENAAGEPSD
ncbi:MAG TPA: DNA topoisomerase IB [Candidatus Binatia bacterium]|nr:DNA topoisomerase IB [Candidatus Binatia bacterium]